MAGHAALAQGDSADALRRFRALRPIAGRSDIAWSPWDALGLERLTEARLLFARGEYAGALKVASVFDSPAPISYLLFTREALELRESAATALNRPELASRYRSRLAALGKPAW
jgi:hypothetical protein